MLRSTRTALAGLLVLSSSAAGCSLPGSGPDAEDAAATLAAGLSSGSLSKVDFTGSDRSARASYAAIAKGAISALGKPKVSAESATTTDDTATARLRWTWQVASKTWTYQTQVRLQQAETADGERWLVRWAPTMVQESLGAGDRLSVAGLAATRGDILGAGDASIVTLRPVLRVGLDKTTLSDAEASASAARLARLVDVTPATFTKQVAASGPRAFVQAIVYRPADAPDAVLSALAGIDGARSVSDRLPLALTKDFAAGVLGTVGPATAEIVEESKGRVQAGDDVGLSGLQRRYDGQLAGTRGAEVVAVDDQGERRELFTADPVAGKPLSTTLEPELETLAQRLLADVGPASALVAIRPSTGALAVVASGPGSKGYNTATFGQYAPGSTFKIVSALALLRAGENTTTTVPCTPTTVVDGKQFKNYGDYPSSALGPITLQTALANSCNTAFVSQRGKLQPGSLGQAAAALGLGVDADIGFPAFFGSVGPEDGQAESETQAAASMIGQGTVLASPMAMAAVVASVLQGSVVLPSLLPDVEVKQTQPEAPLTASEARQLRQMMRAVVTRGSGARLAGLPGQVIAKTGTAEFGDTPPLPTHAWMVAGRDDLAVAVFVDRGASGSQTAGPMLQSFLERAR